MTKGGKGLVRDNLVGKRFNKLVVTKFAYFKKHWSYWECLCDCGIALICKGSNLKIGDRKSCGCTKKNRLDKGIASFNRLLYVYKKSAKSRDLPWLLAKEIFYKLVTSNCNYCGSEPKSIMMAKSANGPFIYNGIDRLNNLIGYTDGNCVSCCGECNEIKRDYTVEEFINKISKIYKHYVSNKS